MKFYFHRVLIRTKKIGHLFSLLHEEKEISINSSTSFNIIV